MKHRFFAQNMQLDYFVLRYGVQKHDHLNHLEIKVH